MARPSWSGQLQISLVSFGINLIPATESKSEIRFHQIDRRTGERIRHQKVLSESEEPVENQEIVKGFEYSKGKYIPIEPEDINQLRIESRHAIALDHFVDAGEIDPAFYEKPYFVLPENAAQADAFAVIRKALEETNSTGLGKIAMGGREHLIAVRAPQDKKLRGLMAYTLRFAEELRDPAQYFSDIKEHTIDREQLALAKELIQRKSAAFRPREFKDTYEAALRSLVEARLKHIELPKEAKREARAKVVNLMDALRKSVGDTGAKKKPPGRVGRKPAQEAPAKHRLKVVRGSDKRRKSA